LVENQIDFPQKSQVDGEVVAVPGNSGNFILLWPARVENNDGAMLCGGGTVSRPWPATGENNIEAMLCGGGIERRELPTPES
jgi:hypothetical protein